MGERYHRSQLLLDPEQHDQMRQIAQREGRSISDVAREAINLGLDALASDEGVRLRRRSLALEGLDQIRQKVHAASGIYEGDLIAEARADRDSDQERVHRGDE